MFGSSDAFIGIALYVCAISTLFGVVAVAVAEAAAYFGAERDRVWSWSASPQRRHKRDDGL